MTDAEARVVADLQRQVRELREELAEWRLRGHQVTSLFATQVDGVRRHFRLEIGTARALLLLIKHAGVAVRRETLADALSPGWNERGVDLQMVDVRICRLRKVLANHGLNRAVHTVWGFGYRLDTVAARDITVMLAA